MAIMMTIWGSALEKYVVSVAWVGISSKWANKGVLSPHNAAVDNGIDCISPSWTSPCR